MSKLPHFSRLALALGLSTTLLISLPCQATDAHATDLGYASSNSTTSSTRATSNDYVATLEQLLMLLEKPQMLQSMAAAITSDSTKQNIISNHMSSLLSDQSLRQVLVEHIATKLQQRGSSLNDTSALLRAIGDELQSATLQLFNGGISRLSDSELQQLLGSIANTANRWDDQTCQVVFSGASNSGVYRTLLEQLDPQDLENFLHLTTQAVLYEVKDQPAAYSMSGSDLAKANTALFKVIGLWAFSDPTAAQNAFALLQGSMQDQAPDPVTLCHTSRQLLTEIVRAEGSDGSLLRRLVVHTYLNQLQ